MYLIVIYTNKTKTIDNIEHEEVYAKFTTMSLKIAKRRANFLRKKYSSFSVVLKEKYKDGYTQINY